MGRAHGAHDRTASGRAAADADPAWNEMSHVVAAAPAIDRFHLVDRCFRELTARGHRTEILSLDAADHAFWCAQGHAASFAAPRNADPRDPRIARIPFAEFAEIERRRGGHDIDSDVARHAEIRLRRLASALLDRFERDRPDLVLFHQTRTGAHALVQFIAREAGVPVLWTGDGILPGTMQTDPSGLDGDAAAARRNAWDYRSSPVDADFLRSSLASIAGKNTPHPLPRHELRAPSALTRALAAWQGRDDGTGPGLWRGLFSWREAQLRAAHPAAAIELPKAPFTTILLQSHDDARMRLDADEPPTPAQLVRAAQRASAAIDRHAEVVAVLPREGLAERELQQLRELDDVHIELAHATAAACMAASAVVTVNAPLAGISLLAGTPLLHLGRAIYGTPGVAFATPLEELTPTLRLALRDNQPELRKRFLTTLLRHGHLWCSPDAPDHNGIQGLVQRIEDTIARKAPFGADLVYRAGPAWPLANENR